MASFTPISEYSFEQLELSDCAEANHDRPLKHHESEFIKGYVKGSIERADTEEKLNKLRDMHLFQTVLSADMAQMLLYSMKEQLSGLFYFDEETGYITPDGLNIVREELIKQYPFWKNVHFEHVHQDHLKKSIEKIATIARDSFKTVFLISRNSAEKFDPHVYPLFVEKREGKIMLAITDSRGTTKDTQPVDAIRDRLQEFALTVYHYPEPRQHDHYTCPVFTLLDIFNVTELEKKEFNLFDYLSKNATLDPERSQGKHEFHKIDALPPCMMKVTQSLTKIDDHLQKPPSPELPEVTRSFEQVFIARPSDNTSLKMAVQKATFYDTAIHKVNHYIQRKWLRFVYLLALRCFQSEKPA